MGAQMIDFRSDTLTKPTQGMLESMIRAEVGDDVFGEDPTVLRLEKMMANIFGMEAGLFCPSGTMANQIALSVHTRPGDEVLCAQGSHIYNYEGGGPAANAGLTVQLISGDRGRISADQIKAHVKPDNPHYPHTALVSLENTCNRGGGSVYDRPTLKEISECCHQMNLPLHLDGARIFNALATDPGYSAKDIGKWFSSVSVCLSKGLGAPIGTVLLGDASFIKQALRVRKRWGGGMRQAGYMAAAGIYALEHHIERITEDHRRAKGLADVLKMASFTSEVTLPQTNIIVVRIKAEKSQEEVLKSLENSGIKAIGFGEGLIRFVTHLDISESDYKQAVEVFSGL
jgi:threonine aldolase